MKVSSVIGWLESLGRDVRRSLRIWRHSTPYAVAATLCIALGIGTSTAVISYYNAIFLRPLPIERPDELVALVKKGGPTFAQGFSYPFYLALEQHRELFGEVLACSGVAPSRLSTSDSPSAARVWRESISGSYFRLLGLSAEAGRLLGDSDATWPRAEANAVISYRLWRDRFGLDLKTIGQVVKIDSSAYTIVGIAPPKFSGLNRDAQVDVWTPVTLEAPYWLTSPELGWLQIFGRDMKLDRSAMTSGLSVIHQTLVRQAQIDSATRNELLAQNIQLKSAASGVSRLRDQLAEPFAVLLAGAGFLFLVVCVNVAGLAVTRGLHKQAECAIRRALGADGGDLVQHHFVETGLIILCGAALGLLLAYWATAGMLAMLPTPDGGTALDLYPNWLVIRSVVALVAVVMLGTGLYPAIVVTRDRSLRQKVIPRRRLLSVLVAAQIGLSFVLLVGAAAFTQTLIRLQRIDPGVHEQNVLTFWLNPPDTYNPEQQERSYRRVLEKLAATPGIASVARGVIFQQGRWKTRLSKLDGLELPKVEVLAVPVSGKYFETIGATRLMGRLFDSADGAGSPKVAIVSRSFATRVVHSGSAVGHTVGVLKGDGTTENYLIVGMVADIAHYGVRESPPSTVYYVDVQQHPGTVRGFVVRYDSSTTRASALVRSAVADVDPALIIYEPYTLTQQIEVSLVRERLLAALALMFGSISLVVAMVGLYGLVSYSVTQQTRDIGIRIALGARSGTIFRLVFAESAVAVVCGITIGVGLGIYGTSLAAALLYGFNETSVGPYVVAAILLGVAATLATYVPARRAIRTDPLAVVRQL